MFSSTKKKLLAVMTLAMVLMAMGTVAATAHDLPDHVCDGPAGDGEHGDNPHCDHDNGEGPGNGHDHDCFELLELGLIDDIVELELCLGIDLDIELDELLDVLDLLEGHSPLELLEWLHHIRDFGGPMDGLRDKIDFEKIFLALGWIKHDVVPGVLGFVFHGVFEGVGNEAGAMLDPGLVGTVVGGVLNGGGYDGGNGGGGSGDCAGVINVCNNANGSIDVTDVIDVCTVNADNGFGNGPGDDGNADCDVVDGLGILTFAELGDVEELVDLF